MKICFFRVNHLARHCQQARFEAFEPLGIKPIFYSFIFLLNCQKSAGILMLEPEVVVFFGLCECAHPGINLRANMIDHFKSRLLRF